MSTATRSKKSDSVPSDCVIDANSLYPISVVQKRLGLGPWALRTARKNGLKVRRIGKCNFILGSDLIDFVRNADTLATAGS